MEVVCEENINGLLDCDVPILSISPRVPRLKELKRAKISPFTYSLLFIFDSFYQKPDRGDERGKDNIIYKIKANQGISE